MAMVHAAFWRRHAAIALMFILVAAEAPRARGQQASAGRFRKDSPSSTPSQQLSKFRPATISEFETTEEGEEAGGKAAEEGAEGETGEAAEKGAGGEAGKELEDAKEGKEEAEKEKEEGEEEGEEEEEEGEEYNETDVEVAWMLLGSVSFVMGLLYLVNWGDDDIRRYSWKIISTTISIFLAVLLFQGFNEVLLLVVGNSGEGELAVFQFLHCLIYIVVLQFTIAFISGAICERDYVDMDLEEWVINDPLSVENGKTVPEAKVRNKLVKRSAVQDEYGMEVPVVKVKKNFERRMRWMRCYARLLAHMAGFAAINAGATMQQISFFKSGFLMAAIPLLITQLFIMIIFKLFGSLRDSMMKAHREAGRAGRRAKMYNEEVFEAENDISALSSSFLLVQVFRFALSGVLPNAEGLEEDEQTHTNSSIGGLFALGFAVALTAVIIALVQAKRSAINKAVETEGEEEEEDEGPRAVVIGLNIMAMTFAWCMLWGTRWLCFNLPSVDVDRTMGRVEMALGLSAVACLAVFGLDNIDDRMRAHGDADSAAQAIKIMVTSLGILIGFSWEHCFDGGVAAVASRTSHPATVKFVMGLLISGVMTPMWSRHILEKEMAYQKLKHDRDCADRKMSHSKMSLVAPSPKDAHDPGASA